MELQLGRTTQLEDCSTRWDPQMLFACESTFEVLFPLVLMPKQQSHYAFCTMSTIWVP
jgi:hypothetical protein